MYAMRLQAVDKRLLDVKRWLLRLFELHTPAQFAFPVVQRDVAPE